MENLKLDLETLKKVKFACNLYSDSSSATLGYRWMCERINELEASEGKNLPTSESALNLAVVSGSLPADTDINKLRDDFIQKWAEMNPTLDKNFYWSGVNDGIYLLLNYLKGNAR
jgi:hypothetical protein